MKIAIISDIHANVYALINLLEDIDIEKVDTIICLGDLVGYGPHPNEVNFHDQETSYSLHKRKL